MGIGTVGEVANGGDDDGCFTNDDTSSIEEVKEEEEFEVRRFLLTLPMNELFRLLNVFFFVWGITPFTWSESREDDIATIIYKKSFIIFYFQ